MRYQFKNTQGGSRDTHLARGTERSSDVGAPAVYGGSRRAGEGLLRGEALPVASDGPGLTL